MNLTEFLTSLRGWTGFLDTTVFTDALLTNFLRMGEERISREMRCQEMLRIDTATITLGRVTMPPDFRAADFVRIVDGNELIFKPRGEFYALGSGQGSNRGYYTTSGRYLMIGGDPSASNEKEVELHYFGDVPPLTGDATWLSTRYPTVLTAATMEWASTRMEDSEQKVNWSDDAGKAIDAVNVEYQRSIGSGSKLIRRVRSFG